MLNTLSRIKQNFKYECYCFSDNFKIYKRRKNRYKQKGSGENEKEERKQNLEQLVYFSYFS